MGFILCMWMNGIVPTKRIRSSCRLLRDENADKFFILDMRLLEKLTSWEQKQHTINEKSGVKKFLS